MFQLSTRDAVRLFKPYRLRDLQNNYIIMNINNIWLPTVQLYLHYLYRRTEYYLSLEPIPKSTHMIVLPALLAPHLNILFQTTTNNSDLRNYLLHALYLMCYINVISCVGCPGDRFFVKLVLIRLHIRTKIGLASIFSKYTTPPRSTCGVYIPV